MSPLEHLEHARGGTLIYRVNGEIYEMPNPLDMAPLQIVDSLQRGYVSVWMRGVPIWKQRTLFEAWVARHDLPDASGARRLYYLMDRYTDAIAYDLQAHLHLDLGVLWRGRRWRTLLAYIDRLPHHSYFAEAVSLDEDHARMLAEAEADLPDGEKATKQTPPLRTWTTEVAVLTKILDAIRHLDYVTVAANSGRGNAGTPPEPSPVPASAFDKARQQTTFERKLGKHKALVGRMLPHKRAGTMDE